MDKQEEITSRKFNLETQYRPLKGGLFINNKRFDNPDAPQWVGNIRDSWGKLWRLAGWQRTGKGGEIITLRMEEMNRSGPRSPDKNKQ